MKKIALFILCLGLAAGAHAQQAVHVVPEKSSDTAAPGLTEAQADEAAKAGAKERLADRDCLRNTGSRVLKAGGKGRKCAIGNGRVFTRDDLDRTGHVDLGSALRSLHPGIH